MNDIMNNTITNIIKLHLNVVLKNKDTTLVIKYRYRTNEFYATTFNNINNTPICLDDRLESLKFNDEEIKKTKHFIQYSHTRLDDNKIYKDYIFNTDYKYENLKFISELLYNHCYDIVQISDCIIDVSAKDKTNITINMNTDCSCINRYNIAVDVKESTKIKGQELTNNFYNVDLHKMDTKESNNLFNTVFKDISSKAVMYHISRKTVNDYIYEKEPKYMYIGMLNNETLKKLKAIKDKLLNKISLTDEERKLIKLKGRICTPYPNMLNTETYDVVKAYKMCDKPPIPALITVPTAIKIVYKIAQNIVDNKL